MTDLLHALELTGYVTEKIVNAFLAGCIPVYWGSRRGHSRWALAELAKLPGLVFKKLPRNVWGGVFAGSLQMVGWLAEKRNQKEVVYI